VSAVQPRREAATGWANRVILLLQPDATRLQNADKGIQKGPGILLRKFWPGWAAVAEVTAIHMVIGLHGQLANDGAFLTEAVYSFAVSGTVANATADS
jgi:hypothetical protein